MQDRKYVEYLQIVISQKSHGKNLIGNARRDRIVYLKCKLIRRDLDLGVRALLSPHALLLRKPVTHFDGQVDLALSNDP